MNRRQGFNGVGTRHKCGIRFSWDFLPAPVAVVCLIAVLAAAGCSGTGKAFGPRTGNGPRVTIETRDIEVAGALDKEIIGRHVKNWMPQIRHCHELAMGRRPGLTGLVRAEWVIMPTGFTTQARVVESTVDDPVMEACIVKRISEWVFPSPKGGGVVKVTYPFRFTGDEPVPRPAPIQ